MVRHYKSQHKRAQWSEQTLKDAIAAVETGISLKKASKDFCIPRTTLRNHWKLRENGGNFCTKKLGRPTVLSEEQEAELVKLILDYESRLFGLTVVDIRRLVYDYCEKNLIKHNFNHSLQSAGEDWARAFIARHPTLSVRKPEPVSIFRASGFNKEKVNRFYDVLEPILYKDNVSIVPPENIFNVDESGYTVCNKPHKIVGKKGKRSIGTLSSAERGKTVTAICCVNACGTFIPPMLIFPRVRFKPELIDKAPAGCIGGASKSGWINETMFNRWFAHFIKFVNPKGKSEPVVLIMDGHSCHVKNLELIDQARSNNVVLVSLPSHCTHKLQPLDISFFKSLNTYYDAEIQTWLRQHPGRVVTEFQIGELFSLAYGKAATVQNGTSGFRKAGIYPFRRDLFTEEDFMCSRMTERPAETCCTAGGSPTQSASDVTMNDQPINNDLHSVSTSNVDDLQPVVQRINMQSDGTPTQSASDVTMNDQPINNDLHSVSTSNVDDLQPVVQPINMQSDGTESACKTFLELLNDRIDQSPCNCAVRKNCKKRRVAHAAVVTSSPYKANIESQVSMSDKTKVKCKVRRSDAKGGRPSTEKRKKPFEPCESLVTGKKLMTVKCLKSDKSGASTTVTPEADQTTCLYCEIKYDESRVKWVRCSRCKLWACCNCAHMGKGKRQYICDTCK